MEQITQERNKDSTSDRLRLLLVAAAKQKYGNGDFEQAIDLLKEALLIAINLPGNNLQTVAVILYQLGRNYHNLKQYDTSLQLFLKSLTIEKTINEKSNAVANILNGIGTVLDVGQKEYRKALLLYEKSLNLKIHLYSLKQVQHVQLSNVLGNIATILFNEQRYEEAEAKIKLAKEIKEKSYG